MRILLLISFLFFQVYSYGQSEVYFSFPDSNTIWYFHYSQYFEGQEPVDVYYTITISEDTLINEQEYHSLTIPNRLCSSATNCAGISLGYKGAIREDTLTRKVYFIPPSENEEQLLYDFKWQVGDTLTGYMEFILEPDIIQTVDSILIGDTYRKRWLLNPYHSIYLIEGIGSTYGLFERSPGPVAEDFGYSLICFQQNGSILYPDTTTTCQFPNFINIGDKIQDQISIIPNPSNGSFIIKFDNLTLKEICIIDLMGNKYFTKNITSETYINIENLPVGLYLVTITDTFGRIINRKILSCP